MSKSLCACFTVGLAITCWQLAAGTGKDWTPECWSKSGQVWTCNSHLSQCVDECNELGGDKGGDTSDDDSSGGVDTSSGGYIVDGDAGLPKILALHGGGGTASGFQSELAPVANALRSSFQFYYVQAPHGGLWIRDAPGGKDQGTTDPQWASESVGVLNQVIQNQGPFWGILGYSQGVAFGIYYLSQVTAGTFQVAMFFNGYMPLVHQGLMQSINAQSPFGNIPALHFIGVHDSGFAGMGQDAANIFTSPTVIVSSVAGHHPPYSDDPTFNQVISFATSRIGNPTLVPSPTPASTCESDTGLLAVVQSFGITMPDGTESYLTCSNIESVVSDPESDNGKAFWSTVPAVTGWQVQPDDLCDEDLGSTCRSSTAFGTGVNEATCSQWDGKTIESYTCCETCARLAPPTPPPLPTQPPPPPPTPPPPSPTQPPPPSPTPSPVACEHKVNKVANGWQTIQPANQRVADIDACIELCSSESACTVWQFKSRKCSMSSQTGTIQWRNRNGFTSGLRCQPPRRLQHLNGRFVQFV